jgi:hypothetical protein
MLPPRASDDLSWLWGRELLADYMVEITEVPLAAEGRQPPPSTATTAVPPRQLVICHGVVLCQASLLLRALVELQEEDAGPCNAQGIGMRDFVGLPRIAKMIYDLHMEIGGGSG